MSAATWRYPLDPDCPIVATFYETLADDPMSESIPGDVLGEISASFEQSHRARCERCQKFGAANVEVLS